MRGPNNEDVPASGKYWIHAQSGAVVRAQVVLDAKTSKADFVAFRTARDAQLEAPVLILPAMQVNIRAGELPAPESNGTAYLKIPLDRLGAQR